MKIAVSAQTNREDARIDRRLGRAAYIAVYDDQTKQWDFIANTQDMQAAQGAGIQVAQHIINSGAEVLLTSNIGPKAMKALQSCEVKIFQVSRDCTLTEAVQECEKGNLTQLTDANVEGHWM